MERANVVANGEQIDVGFMRIATRAWTEFIRKRFEIDPNDKFKNAQIGFFTTLLRTMRGYGAIDMEFRVGCYGHFKKNESHRDKEQRKNKFNLAMMIGEKLTAFDAMLMWSDV